MEEDRKITIVTHSSNFHTDDIFAVATLLLVLDKGHEISVVRSRENEIIEKADYAVDVGRVYDESKNRFDHHQTGGAGVRNNTIPYASFGLVWKKHGEKLCGSVEVFEQVDKMLVQPIDALDNGTEISQTTIPGVYPFHIGTITSIFRPTWKEEDSLDDVFLKLVSYAKVLILRVISSVRDAEEGYALVDKAYSIANDKRIVILDEKLPWMEALAKFPEPLYVVYPKPISGTWSLKGVRSDPMSFELRKNLPKSWAGKEGEELEKITGVSGALFCHRDLFTAGAKTKEAILKLAELALKN